MIRCAAIESDCVVEVAELGENEGMKRRNVFKQQNWFNIIIGGMMLNIKKLNEFKFDE